MRRIVSGLTRGGPEGRVLEEDRHLVVLEHDLYMVVAGVSGDRGHHEARETPPHGSAARLATETIADYFRMMELEGQDWPFPGDPDLSEEEDHLTTSLLVANRRFFDRNERGRLALAGTAVVACYAPRANRLSLGRVGDSRGYRVRGGSLALLTRGTSHPSPTRVMLQAQEAGLPWELGARESVAVNLVSDTPQPGDVYLLCSRALSEAVPEARILDVVSFGAEPEGICRRLVGAALEGGGEGPVTAMAIAFAEDEVEAVGG